MARRIIKKEQLLRSKSRESVALRGLVWRGVAAAGAEAPGGSNGKERGAGGGKGAEVKGEEE